MLVSLRFVSLVAQGKGDDFRLKAPTTRSVPIHRMLPVHEDEQGDLQVTLYLNRARCWLQLGQAARAVQDSLLAIALLQAGSVADRPRPPQMLNFRILFAVVAALVSIMFTLRQAAGKPHVVRYVINGVTALVALLMIVPWVLYYVRTGQKAALTEPSDAKTFCKAYFLRARARLAKGQLSLAEADAAVAEEFADSEQLRQLQQFRREVANTRRSNKRLSKEVAKWCDKAMAKARPDAFVVAEAVEDE